jgi:phospholipase C
MLTACTRFACAAVLIAGLALVPNAAFATTPTAPPFPVTTPYVTGANPATATPIQHLVVIFQENVSFDHYFGTYPDALNPAGEPKFTPLPGTPIPDNYLSNPTLLTANPNKDSGGTTDNPFRLDRTENVTCDQDHNYDDEQKAADGNATGTSAAMDQFVTIGTRFNPTGCAHPDEEMGYFDGNTVTGMWNLAQHFALNDNSFGTGYGPSTPGALNLVAGQTAGVGSTLNNPQGAGDVGSTGTTVVGDADPFGDDCASPSRAQVQMTTSAGASTGPLNIGDALNAKHLSWGWFQGGFRPSSVTAGGVAT